MLKELFTVSPGDAPLVSAQAGFSEMLQMCEEAINKASEVYWGGAITKEERKSFFKRDVRINKLERDVRASIITHLSGPGTQDIPYSLMLMSLVKDLERIGDHARNLLGVPRMTHDADQERTLPDDEVVQQLKKVAEFVERLAHEARETYTASDLEKATQLTRTGRSNAKLLDELIGKIASSQYPAKIAVDLTLAVRFYKRIQGHLLNLLSSVLMPLHKLDYFDEDEIPLDD